jgi:hypothetical protein
MSEIKILDKKLKNCESIIYLIDKNIICKVPKNDNYNDNIIRSYYIGKVLNSLQYILPNFIKTYKLEKNNRGQFLLYTEYIKGKTFAEVLNSLSFSDFLNIFLQILLALELARQYYNFTHYDLHLSNIILKPLKVPLSYTVKINNKKYVFHTCKYLAIIIDFGYSYLQVNDEIICAEGLEQYGINSENSSSIDMYKLLFHSYVKSEGNLRKNILKLFYFFDEKEPYNILQTPFKKLNHVPEEYFKKVLNLNYTPIEFVFWISQNKSFLRYKRDHFQEHV